MSEIRTLVTPENFQLLKDALVFLVPIAIGLAKISSKKFSTQLDLPQFSVKQRQKGDKPNVSWRFRFEAFRRGMSVAELQTMRAREDAENRASPLRLN